MQHLYCNEWPQIFFHNVFLFAASTSVLLTTSYEVNKAKKIVCQAKQNNNKKHMTFQTYANIRGEF